MLRYEKPIGLGAFFIYFHIGGLATTNILRLTRGNSLSVRNSQCVCDACGTAISPLLQLPVVSFVVCRGKCRHCGAAIPVYPLILELAIMLGMFGISRMLDMRPAGILLSFAYYELVRIVTVCIRGKREAQFARQYAIAFVSMIPFLLMTLLVGGIRLYI